jgi:hypothetical protein
MGIKEFIPFLKEEQEPEGEKRDELRSCQDKLKLYELIFHRYKDMIEQRESKTVTDLKALIKPSDETIVRKKAELTDKIRPYIFEQHFLEAAEEAHKLVRTIRTYVLPVDFWLSPKEVLELRGGDPMDKAVFLCSLLIALENAESYVVAGTNKGIKIAVAFKFNNEWHLLDPISAQHVKGKKEDLVQQWFGDMNRVYEFNDKEYSLLKEDKEEEV